MRDSLQEITRQGNKAYTQSVRTDWITEWAGQVVLCVSKLYWTQEVEEAISNGTVKDYVTKLNNQLTDIVNKVRRERPECV